MAGSSTRGTSAASCRREVVAGLNLGQAGGEVSQPRLAKVDHGELDESAAHGRRVARPAVPGACRETPTRHGEVARWCQSAKAGILTLPDPGPQAAQPGGA